LKSFNLGNQFGVAVVNLINNHFSSSEEKDKLEEIFKFLDANGDGVISKQELLDGYSKIYGQTMA
jgi:calcium-dependent protein kinase